MYQGELLLIYKLNGAIFGEDLHERLGLRSSEALAGHWTCNGSTISFTIRIAPKVEIGGVRLRQFPRLPYTAHGQEHKLKKTKLCSSVVTCKPADLQKIAEKHPNAIYIGIDMGT